MILGERAIDGYLWVMFERVHSSISMGDPQSNRASPLFSSTEPAENPAAESSSAGSSTEFP